MATDPELTQMLELAEDIKIVIFCVFNKLSRTENKTEV